MKWLTRIIRKILSILWPFGGKGDTLEQTPEKETGMTEREMIEEAQDQLAALKATLRKLRDENVKAGRRGAANATLGLIGDLTRFHANAMSELDKHYPEFSGEVQDRGEIVALGGGGPRG